MSHSTLIIHSNFTIFFRFLSFLKDWKSTKIVKMYVKILKKIISLAPNGIYTIEVNVNFHLTYICSNNLKVEEVHTVGFSKTHLIIRTLFAKISRTRIYKVGLQNFLVYSNTPVDILQ